MVVPYYTTGESINVTLSSVATEAAVREVLGSAPGLELVDDRAANEFPEPVKASPNSNINLSLTLTLAANEFLSRRAPQMLDSSIVAVSIYQI